MAEQNKGASAEADRAVVNGAASVSAVPASVPSADEAWAIALAAYPDDPLQAGRLSARLQRGYESPLPEYGEWLPEVWEAYLRDLVGWDRVANWARLPATFRWHEFHERLAQAIETRRAETGTGSVHESAVATPCAPKP